jgi:hypothetical protein
MDQLHKVLNILEVQFPWAACEFTAWSDYITSVLVEPSNAEECASREADTVKDFMIPCSYRRMVVSLTSGEIFRLTITVIVVY